VTYRGLGYGLASDCGKGQAVKDSIPLARAARGGAHWKRKESKSLGFPYPPKASLPHHNSTLVRLTKSGVADRTISGFSTRHQRTRPRRFTASALPSLA